MFGVAIGVVVALLIAPPTSADPGPGGVGAQVGGVSIERDAQHRAETMAAAATVQVEARECEPLDGTGVVLRSGVVLTNAHVLGGGTRFTIVEPDGSRRSSGVAQSSVDTDVATGIAPPSASVIGLELATEDPHIGDQVVIAGHPRGGPLRVRPAAMAGARPGRGPHDPPTVLRLDVHLQPGESGSPVVDQQGRLVGLAYSTEHGTDAALVIPVSRIRHAMAGLVTASRHC
jgi:S1-C subfamily serine protease